MLEMLSNLWPSLLAVTGIIAALALGIVRTLRRAHNEGYTARDREQIDADRRASADVVRRRDQVDRVAADGPAARLDKLREQDRAFRGE